MSFKNNTQKKAKFTQLHNILIPLLKLSFSLSKKIFVYRRSTTNTKQYSLSTVF